MPLFRSLVVVLIPALVLMASCTDRRGTFDPDLITTKEIADSDFKELLDAQLTFVDEDGLKWVAPKGTWTDGASVPRLALPITDGRFDKGFLKAAVVHDAYCQEENETRTPDQYQTRPWQDTHRMFYEACLAGGTPSMTAKIMYAAVYLGGPKWDDPDDALAGVSNDTLNLGMTGSRRWIEANDPSIEEIEAYMEDRGRVLVEFDALDRSVKTAIESGDLQRAGTTSEAQKRLVERELQAQPADPMLLNLRGLTLKNEAVLQLRSGDLDRSAATLDRAERSFTRVLEAEPKDANALTGLGSVAILRGDRAAAELRLNEALAVAPRLEAARIELSRVRVQPEPEPD